MARKKEAQVSFYEICDETGKPFDAASDWQGFLAEVKAEPIESRQFPIHGVNTVGEIYGYRGADHLVLARQRDSVSSLNKATGEIIDHDSDVNVPWVEISVIHFLPDTNKLAFVLLSNASPHPSSLEYWLNAKRIFDQAISVQPVFDRNTVAKLKGAASANLVQVTFSPGQTKELNNTKGLFEFGQQMQEKYGQVTVSLELKIEGRTHSPESRAAQNILNEVKNLAGGTEFKKAAAKILSVDENGKERVATLNFINHRLAKKVRIELANREKKTVRVHSVLDAVYQAAGQLKSDLYDV